MTNYLRGITVVAALASLAACSESTPVGVLDGPAFSKNGGASVSGSGGSAKANEAKLEIRLARDPLTTFLTASGKAKFESKRGDSRFSVEVEHIPAGTNVIFLLGGVQIGTKTANALGEAELNLRGTAAPLSVAGLAVEVTTDANAPIVKGAFQ